MKPIEAQINLDNPINILRFKSTIDGRDKIHGMQTDLGFFPNFNKYRGKGLRIKIPK